MSAPRSAAALVLAVALLTGCGERDSGPRPESATVAIEGASVFYRDLGEGEPVLLLVHGWAADHTVWRYQLEALPETNRVLALDLPGYGKSEASADITMALLHAALMGVLDDAGVEKAVLVGHGDGTPVSISFHRRHPERVQALVVVDGRLEPLIGDEIVLERFAETLGGPDYLDFVVGMVTHLFPESMDPDERQELQDLAIDTPQHVLRDSFLAANDLAYVEHDPIEIPILVFDKEPPAGAEELAAQYERYVRERAPRVDFRIAPGTGHVFMMEAPERFHEMLREFLAGV